MENDAIELDGQSSFAITALLALLTEKGIITKEEYMQTYDMVKKVAVDYFIEEAKKKL